MTRVYLRTHHVALLETRDNPTGASYEAVIETPRGTLSFSIAEALHVRDDLAWCIREAGIG